MIRLANFALFQAVWLVAVTAAARGSIWTGPACLPIMVGVHLALVRGNRERVREACYLLFVGLLGSAADSLLMAAGLTAYPTSEAAWPLPFVPPWIAALWIAFATLPRFSLAWLKERATLAALCGASGGPLSYFAGSRMGAVAYAEQAWRTWAVLALEYALVTPLLLRFAPVTPPDAAERSVRPPGPDLPHGRPRPPRAG